MLPAKTASWVPRWSLSPHPPVSHALPEVHVEALVRLQRRLALHVVPQPREKRHAQTQLRHGLEAPAAGAKNRPPWDRRGRLSLVFFSFPGILCFVFLLLQAGNKKREHKTKGHPANNESVPKARGENHLSYEASRRTNY